MTETPTPTQDLAAEEIRARYVEAIARELFAIDADLAGYGPDDFEDWAPRYRRKAEPFVDALAAAGLLPTISETRVAYAVLDEPETSERLVRRYLTDWQEAES